MRSFYSPTREFKCPFKLPKILTRSKCEKYDAYIERIKTDPLAIEVKLADLKHNMDGTRNKTGITPEDIERTIKYHRHYVELYNCLPDHN